MKTPVAFLAFLLAASLGAAQEHSVDKEPVAQIRLAGDYTAVFQWDENHLGVLSPGAAQVLIWNPDSNKTRTLQLAADLATAAPGVYPDVISRGPFGHIYWLSRPTGRIAIIRETGQSISTFSTEFAEAFWMALRPDGLIEVFGVDENRSWSGFRTLNRQGEVIEERAGWLAPSRRHNDFARTFFFVTPQGRTEVLAHFPFARRGVRDVVSLLPCDALPEAVSFAVNEIATGPLPAPLGEGFQPNHSSYPVVTAAGLVGQEVGVLLNGAVLALIGSEGESRCTRLPLPPMEEFFYSSLAVVDGRLALMAKDANETWIGMWSLGTILNERGKANEEASFSRDCGSACFCRAARNK